MSSNNLIKTKKKIFIWYSHEHSDQFVIPFVMPIENFSVDSFKKYQKIHFKKINNETTKISGLYFEKNCILSGF